MRRIALLLATLAFAAGCVDGLGIQTTCLVEMERVSSEYGPPDHTQEDEDRGDHSEVWYYDDTGRKFEFRWGFSYEECQVVRGTFVRSPTPE